MNVSILNQVIGVTDYPVLIRKDVSVAFRRQFQTDWTLCVSQEDVLRRCDASKRLDAVNGLFLRRTLQAYSKCYVDGDLAAVHGLRSDCIHTCGHRRRIEANLAHDASL